MTSNRDSLVTGKSFRAIVLLAACCAATGCIFSAGMARAQHTINRYHGYYEVPSDGAGGYKARPKWTWASRPIKAGTLNDTHQIEPPPGMTTSLQHLEVYSNSTGSSFWTSARNPITRSPHEDGWNIGGNSYLILTKYYRKDSDLGKLDFTIPKILLSAFGPRNVPTNNQGLWGHVRLEMTAQTGTYREQLADDGRLYQIFEDVSPLDDFAAGATLTGWPTQYDCQLDDDSVALDFGVLQGGPGEQVIECGLNSAYKHSVDLTGIRVGTDIKTVYRIESTSIDTIQIDTILEAFARDPTKPDGGVQVTYEGLTPITLPPPEPVLDPVILSPTAVLGTDMGTLSEEVGTENMYNHSGVDDFVSGTTKFDAYISNAGPADGHYIQTWQSDWLPDGESGGFIDFDFGDSYIMDRLAVYNGKVMATSIHVSESPDGPWNHVGDFTLDPKPGITTAYFPDILEFDEPTEARYLRMEVNSTYPLLREQDGVWYAVIGEIAASVIPNSTLPGDFDQNGILDASDIDLLATAIQQGATDPIYDVSLNGAVDEEDLSVWVQGLKDTYFGDANLNGVFDSGDLTEVFIAGEYEDGIPLNSTWETGDWNGNKDFESGDLVSAFADGGYEEGPRPAVRAVPEPTAALPSLVVIIGLLRYRRRFA